MADAILRLIPLAQSIAIAGDNVKFLEKKHKTPTDFVGQGVKNIVGIALAKETANIVESF